MRIDTAVSAEVLRLLSPLALDAALEAIDDRQQKSTALLGQTELMLQHAQYEADRARRQYDAIDPENRLVAGELERRWNERLENVARFEKQLQARRAEIAPTLDPTERTELLALATDLPRLWNHPAASMSTRKRLLRTLLEEIVVCVEPGRLLLKLHWKGGDHTALEVPKNRWGQHRWKTSDVTVELIRDLARLLPDERIASLLNRLGVRSAKGNTWTLLRVRSFRCQHQIGVYRDGERAERGEMILKEAAAFLGVSKMTVIRLIKSEVLPARQPCAGAPYVIRQHDLEAPAVQRAIAGGRIACEPRQIAMEGVV
jgi:excisionase family DNA binding protein